MAGQLQLLQYENSRLRNEVVKLGGQLEMTKYNYEKLLEWVERIPHLESNWLPLLKNTPPSLLQTNYKSIKFWLEKAYEEYQKPDGGNTNSLAIRKPRHGQPLNSSEDDDEKHPYLEDGEGVPDLGNWTNGQHVHMPHGGRTFGDRKMEGSDNDMHNSDATAQNINWLTINMPMPETVPSGTVVAETHPITEIFDPLDDNTIFENIDKLPNRAPPIANTSTISQSLPFNPHITIDPSANMSTSNESNTASTITPTATPATALSNAPSNLGGPMLPTIPVNAQQRLFLTATQWHLLDLAAMTTASNPLVLIENSLETAQPAKKSRAAPAAVVSTGMTEKNFAMKDWLKENPGGSKANFENYLKLQGNAARAKEGFWGLKLKWW
ncbi:hypothetical protein L208DRAFT_1380721 [Tricholoma matsutake]|nr:hypothetical protein L208DRAFT_1380721 [Tricholoma matsutake 945]